MRRFAVLATLAALPAAALALPQETKSLARVVIPNEPEAARDALKNWIEARGFDVEARPNSLLMKKGGIVINLYPIVSEDELDRIRVIAFYSPTDEAKGTPEFKELASSLNEVQNFLQIWVDTDGDLVVGSNITFYDELSAREFDAFLDLYVAIIKRYVLTEEALKMLK